MAFSFSPSNSMYRWTCTPLGIKTLISQTGGDGVLATSQLPCPSEASIAELEAILQRNRVLFLAGPSHSKNLGTARLAKIGADGAQVYKTGTAICRR